MSSSYLDRTKVATTITMLIFAASASKTASCSIEIAVIARVRR